MNIAIAAATNEIKKVFMSTNDLLFNNFNLIVPSTGTIGNNPNKIKTSALVGSVIGTTLSTAFIIKSNKAQKTFTKKVLTSNFASNKNLFMIGMSSILGGLAGGVAQDKDKNIWKKIKEMNFQILSNVAGPLLFLNLFKNFSANLTKNSSKAVKNISNFISVFGGVAVGAFSGALVANKINKDIIKPEIPYERRLGVKDFLIHVDDLPVALAMTNIPYIDKAIPLVLVSRGYEVGKQ